MKSFQVSGRTKTVLGVIAVLAVLAVAAIMGATAFSRFAMASDRLHAPAGPFVTEEKAGPDRCNPLGGMPDGGAYVCPTRIVKVRNPLSYKVVFSIDCDGLVVRDLYDAKAKSTRTIELHSDEAGEEILGGLCWVQGWRKAG